MTPTPHRLVDLGFSRAEVDALHDSVAELEPLDQLAVIHEAIQVRAQSFIALGSIIALEEEADVAHADADTAMERIEAILDEMEA